MTKINHNTIALETVTDRAIAELIFVVHTARYEHLDTIALNSGGRRDSTRPNRKVNLLPSHPLLLCHHSTMKRVQDLAPIPNTIQRMRTHELVKQ